LPLLLSPPYKHSHTNPSINLSKKEQSNQGRKRVCSTVQYSTCLGEQRKEAAERALDVAILLLFIQ